MSDFPRPAKSMSAPHVGFAPVRPARVGAMALALVATMLPGVQALARARVARAAPHHTVEREQTGSRVAPSRHGMVLPVAARASAKHSSVPARSMRFPEAQAHVQVLPANRHGHAAAVTRASQPVVQPTARQHEDALPHTTGIEVAADRSTKDRVHAWYKLHSAGTSAALLTTDEVQATQALKRASAALIVGAAKRTPPPSPDLSLTPGKATAADFNRAVQKQAEINRAAAALKSTRSTAADDAAFAEASNIPSTAPTEREPAPFLHGDLLAGTAHDVMPPKQATLTPKPETPSVIRIDPRGDAEVLSAAAANPAAAPVRLLAADALSMPKPSPILRSPAPAAGTVVAAAGKPKLDPRIADSMAQQILDPIAEVTPVSKSAQADTSGKTLAAGAYEADLSAGPLVKVNLYDTAGKLILLPAMKGSHEILVHQNQMAIADGLDRVDDDNQLLDMRKLKLLIALPDSDAMYPDERLPLNRRFARPWTVRFLNDLSRAHYARFQTPLIVTSAVRTVAFQRRLVLTNGNAAPPTGEVASPHLYGQAVDIAKHGMSVTEIAWMRSYLTPVESAGKIDVEEEFQQACFHLSVYRRYLGLPAPRSTPPPETAPSRMLQQAKAAPAKRRHLPTALLATGLR